MKANFSKAFHIRVLSPDLIKSIKIKAAELGITMTVLVERAVTTFMGER